MNKLTPKFSLALGIILLIIAAAIFGFGSSSPNISASDQAQCEQSVTQKYGKASDLLSHCQSDVGFVTMMKAQDTGSNPAETAKAISAANNKDTGLGMLGKFFMGICLAAGLILTINGLIGLRKPK